MFLNNAMDRINRLIIQGGRTGMTELQFFAAEIKEWKDSPRRKDQLRGDLYYEGQHDILKRQRTIIGEDGKLQVVNNLPNNRLIDNQYALMVDQKTNYLVGKPFTLNCQDKSYTDALGKIFNKRFYRLLKYVCEDALNGGLGWVYPYYTDAGELAFKHFPAYDILPFWADDDHTILDCAVRYYTQEVWNGYTKEKVEKVEIFKPAMDTRYSEDNVVSHDQNSIRSTPIDSSGSILLLASDIDVVGIDEAQFLDNGLVEVCNELANRGVRVIVAGLDMDFKGVPFGPIPALCAIADEVTKVHAICVKCGALAYVSHRLVANDKRVLLGEQDEYEPLCRDCYQKAISQEK